MALCILSPCISLSVSSFCGVSLTSLFLWDIFYDMEFLRNLSEICLELFTCVHT